MKIAFVLASCAACVGSPEEVTQVPRATDWVQSADGARCATVRIAAEHPVGVRAVRVDFPGDARVALYRAADATPACAALGMGDPLMVATPRQRELVLPDGVAFE